jgi:hypothetical protein
MKRYLAILVLAVLLAIPSLTAQAADPALTIPGFPITWEDFIDLVRDEIGAGIVSITSDNGTMTIYLSDNTSYTIALPPGTPGETGPIGPTGPQGIPGPAGDTGPQGEQGEQGIQGIQGLIGLPGPTGLIGPVGSQGPIGLTGPQGLVGEKGEQGIQGYSYTDTEEVKVTEAPTWMLIWLIVLSIAFLALVAVCCTFYIHLAPPKPVIQ